MVIEELLQFLVCEVDAELLQAVVLSFKHKLKFSHSQVLPIYIFMMLRDTLTIEAYIKDLKSGNVQHTNEELSGLSGVQHLIDPDDHPQEHFFID